MVTLQSMDLEYKLGVLLGAVSLVISLFLGMIAGNGFGPALVKSLILTFVFIIVGFGSGYILKRFVPEVYNVLSSRGAVGGQESESRDIDAGISDESLDESSGIEETPLRNGEMKAGGEMPGVNGDVNVDEKFVPMGNDSFQKLSSVDTAGGKMGKHLFQEKKIKYEPKIMAEAIRTMMIRDNE